VASQSRLLCRLTFSAPQFVYDRKKSFCEQFGLVYARGAEVDERYDENGKVIPEWEMRQVNGDDRKLRLLLDPQQYQLDTARMVREGAEDVYETFNLIVRRKPKENNFKSILECMRDLMSTKVSLPSWLEEVFLGYGDPDGAHWSNIEDRVDELDFKDTFLDWKHLQAAFPGRKVALSREAGKFKNPQPPFKLCFPEEEDGKAPIIVTPYALPNMGPYPRNVPKKNPIPFTPTQVSAIRSGLNHGLSMVVGPPGTGKTDVAVQIISNLYHSFPEQRTLIITHANQALNDIFEKIMVRDVDERYLLRLGHGAKDLDTESEFTIRGRVDYMLQRRLDRLAECAKLAASFGLAASEYTCETAAHFKLFHVDSRWQTYQNALRNPAEAGGDGTIDSIFPYTEFFADAPGGLFSGDGAADMEAALGCHRYFEEMFTELLECRPFELLKTARDRGLYLMAKQAKIIALTCTHASLKRHDFLKFGLKYDNLIMEEAAQVLEIETFIPMQLQTLQDGRSRLKRVVLIGDHHQLPPVVQNMSLQKYAHLDQSLFARFVRLGNPIIQLDKQGRARPELCDLYRWRYDSLGDLDNGSTASQPVNPGLAHAYQMVDVPDFNSQGETTPTAYFYQNLGEAEYVVAMYMYMRLCGAAPRLP
jgi:intron-binding protein aquarius